MKNPNLTELIISPPFGQYIETNNTTSVKGTFTLEKRPGLIWNALKSIRYKYGGIINKMGFRNSGLNKMFTEEDKKHIISIALTKPSLEFPNIDHKEQNWINFLKYFPTHKYMIEVNVGCPNAGTYNMPDYMINVFLNVTKLLIFKIPPTDKGLEELVRLYWYGARTFHIANTISTKTGGLSGPMLQTESLYIIEKCRKLFPKDDYTIIGGGGIYNKSDIELYRSSGADHFSLSTIFMKHPINAYNILKSYETK